MISENARTQDEKRWIGEGVTIWDERDEEQEEGDGDDDLERSTVTVCAGLQTIDISD